MENQERSPNFQLPEILRVNFATKVNLERVANLRGEGRSLGESVALELAYIRHTEFLSRDPSLTHFLQPLDPA